jgi:hypothetical protein
MDELRELDRELQFLLSSSGEWDENEVMVVQSLLNDFRLCVEWLWTVKDYYKDIEYWDKVLQSQEWMSAIDRVTQAQVTNTTNARLDMKTNTNYGIGKYAELFGLVDKVVDVGVDNGPPEDDPWIEGLRR